MQQPINGLDEKLSAKPGQHPRNLDPCMSPCYLPATAFLYLAFDGEGTVCGLFSVVTGTKQDCYCCSSQRRDGGNRVRRALRPIRPPLRERSGLRRAFPPCASRPPLMLMCTVRDSSASRLCPMRTLLPADCTRRERPSSSRETWSISKAQDTQPGRNTKLSAHCAT